MNLQTYMDLYQLLQQKGRTHATSRAFALDKQLLEKSSEQKLIAWVLAHRKNLSSPSSGEKLCKYLYSISLILGIFALILGFLTGVGLLSYSGKTPVNIIYFLAVAVIIPVFTMLLTLFSMLQANKAQSLLVHISPSFWMERVLGLFSGHMQVQLSEMRLSPLLLNWLVINRAQRLAFLFSLGLLLALLGIVATKDIAFGWSTTLQISAEQFHAILENIALPWRDWLPSAVPSIELIEKSHFFRLGEKLNIDMVANVSLLGEWWRFLACATLFYAIFLRILVWMIAKRGFSKALLKSLMSIEGAERLLYEMQVPVVSTAASSREIAMVGQAPKYGRVVHICNPSYQTVLGWAIDDEGIRLLNDAMGIETEYFFDVGGTKTLEEDSHTLQKIRGEVLLYVKSWEPPTMDLMDLLEELATKADKIIIVPIGTIADGYSPKAKELDIWERKLQLVDFSKVWLCRIN